MDRMVEKKYSVAGDGWYDRPVPKTVYVLRNRSGVQAISPSCTHLGCPVQWSEGSRSFICPCHGGVFDETGRVIGGPPKRPLERIQVRAQNGRLYLLVGGLIPPTPKVPPTTTIPQTRRKQTL